MISINMFAYCCALLMMMMLFASSNGKIVEDSCQTPNSEKGICINLQECPKLSAMANDLTTPMTLARLRFLINSHCGFTGSNPKVCCPVDDNNIIDNDVLI